MSRTTRIAKKASTTRSEVIALTASIRADLDTLAQTFWDIGAKLAKVKEGALYEALDYASFQAYAEGELRVKFRQVAKMMAIARTYVRADAVELGVERSAALMGYCRTLHPTVDPGELLRADAMVGETPVSACTVSDILSATAERRARARAKLAARPGTRADARDAKTLARAVRAFALESQLGRAKVAVRDDEVVIRFSRAVLRARLIRE